MIRILVNGAEVLVEPGSSVAAALLSNGVTAFRHSVTGEPRAALCGMGICFECRVQINGALQVRSCQVAVREGMRVTT